MEVSAPWWEDPTYDRAVHGLIVIGSLQRNQRLTTEAGDTMSACPQYFGQCVMRWVYCEGRDANLAAVRRVLSESENALIMASREIERIERIERIDGDAEWRPHSPAKRLVVRILGALRGALVGTANLRETYRDDAGCCATLIQIEQHIKELLRDFYDLGAQEDDYGEYRRPSLSGGV